MSVSDNEKVVLSLIMTANGLEKRGDKIASSIVKGASKNFERLIDENKQLIETSHTANKELRGEVERLEGQVAELKEQLVDAVGAMNASKSVVLEIDLKYGVKTMIGHDSMSVMLDESINEASQLLNKLGEQDDRALLEDIAELNKLGVHRDK